MNLPVSLTLDSLPQLSLGTAALFIFIACASLAVLRGIARILTGSLILCASGAAAYLAWRHAPLLSIPHGSWLVPSITGVITFVFLRGILRYLVKPLGSPNDEVADANKRSPLRWLFTTVLSLIPAAILSVTGAAAVRSAGSISEISRFADRGRTPVSGPGLLAEWKDIVNRILPDDWLHRLDPIADDARVTLAKLVALGDRTPPPSAIKVLEEPEIRNLIRNDARLRELAKARRYGDILRDSRLDHIVANPDLHKMLVGLDL